MSRIIIMSADPSAPGAKAVSALRKVNPMSISAARRALSGAEPLVDSVVFENDHERVAALIRSVCRSLREMERPFRIYELAPDEGWANHQRGEQQPRLQGIRSQGLARDKSGARQKYATQSVANRNVGKERQFAS